MRAQLIILLTLGGLLFASCKREIKVACVGDSITEGAGLNDQSRAAYPVILNTMLGHDYLVFNCGRSGATMQKNGDLPYWKCKEFYNVFAFRPDIIIITLGTNDSKNYNWKAMVFEKDFQAMIDTFNTIRPKPRIYICLPPPVFKMAWSIDDSTVLYGIIPLIVRLGKINDLPLIDLNHKMRGQPAMFPDGVHPDENGAKVIAGIIAGELKK